MQFFYIFDTIPIYRSNRSVSYSAISRTIGPADCPLP